MFSDASIYSGSLSEFSLSSSYSVSGSGGAFGPKKILLEVGCLGFAPVLVVSASWCAGVVRVLTMASAVSVLVSASLALLKLSSSALLAASSSGLSAFAVATGVLVFSGKGTAPSVWKIAL